MFQKEQIDFNYRLICLIMFVLVIILSYNIVTLAIICFFFFYLTRKENNLMYALLLLFCFAFMIFSYYSNSDFLVPKALIIICYFYYFLIIPSLSDKLKEKGELLVDKMLHVKEEKAVIEDNNMEDSDYEYLRFKNSKEEKKKVKRMNLPTIVYLAFHLLFLFFSIMVGGVLL